MRPFFIMQRNSEHMQHCRTIVSTEDYPLYVQSLFAPEELRRPVLALAAWYIETAKCMDASENPLVCQIRLQWWQDAIEQMQGGIFRAHPILKEIEAQPGLHPYFLDMAAMLEARQAHLEEGTTTGAAEARAYAEATGGAFFRLLNKLMGQSENDIAATHLGTAVSLLRYIRALPFVYEDAAETFSDLRKLAGELLNFARAECDEARRKFAACKRAELGPFLLYRLTVSELKRIEKRAQSLTEWQQHQGHSALYILCQMSWAVLRGGI